MSSSVTSIASFQKQIAQMLPSLSPAEAEVLGSTAFRDSDLGWMWAHQALEWISQD